MKVSPRLAAVIVAPALALGLVIAVRSPTPLPRVSPPSSAPAPRPAATTRAAISAPIPPRLEADGSVTAELDAVELAERPTDLVAKSRRAWRVGDLVVAPADRPIRAVAADGSSFDLDQHAVVVRRESGELYVGFLDPTVDPSLPFADRERPSQRIEQVVRLVVATPSAAAPKADAAAIAVVVDGAQVDTVTASTFSALAKTSFKGQRGDDVAIDVAQAFRASLVSVDAGGTHTDLTPPTSEARGVLYMNRRQRFKFAWVDASGEPIGEKQREVTQIALRTR